MLEEVFPRAVLAFGVGVLVLVFPWLDKDLKAVNSGKLKHGKNHECAAESYYV